MAAIVQPHRLPTHRPALPELRLLPGGAARRTPSRLLPALAMAVLLLVAVVGAVAVGRGALAGLAPAPAATSPIAGGRTVVVQPGDTLWTIARRIQPAGDVRALVDRLVAAHGSAPLQPGERVSVPR